MNKNYQQSYTSSLLTPKVFKIALLTASIAFTSTVSFASTQNWQPVASESLIKLPANLIEKRIQQDFEMSPMAQSLLSIEQEVSAASEQIKNLQALVVEAPEGEWIEERVNLVQLKSSYLDLMQQSQNLRQDALDRKQDLYEDVLTKLHKQANLDAKQATAKLKQQQEKARQRMEAVMAQVDQTLLHDGYDKPSPYADEFAHNLSKIEQLKQAISAHKASVAPTIDGVEVSAQEYVRQLLMQASTEQSLLDQESLMLSYMAKLVALDAQALEYEIAYEQEDEGFNQAQMTKPAQAVDLFL
ncbi:hypothetical protein [Glaciecola sp. KUL10]|uniref:hypothetical protein n=1 Tax=Glaciecola sp. (strain KUL10) TaxID=2161813 RepID=UPI000D787A6C|nr:hypothetical protein [Glaciecola sp. KUL10]GBL05406.1 hypothetical protein KUL10_27260 [Glaciecola sp. KUL10]